MTTSYNFFYGGLSAPKYRTEVTIFQFKTLQKVSFLLIKDGLGKTIYIHDCTIH